MFLEFFELSQQPFGVTPDPMYLYPSQTHCEALDAITEGILGGRGFLALIAEPGMGKTTLLYQVLDGLRDTARSVFIFQTQCNSREFFQYLLSELKIDSAGMGLVTMHNKLNEVLFAEMLAGKRFVLIVDEAQNLDDSVLETIRLLSNFETPNTKLLQIVLAGQPQLRDKLAQKHLSQLLQRITVVKDLKAFSTEETAGYIRHRLRVAGHRGADIFKADAVAFIARASRGVPRDINKICYQALVEAHAEASRTVSGEIARKAERKLRLTSNLISAPEAAVTPRAEDADPRVSPSLLTYSPQTWRASRSRRLWTGMLAALMFFAGLGYSRHFSWGLLHGLRTRVAERVADQASAATNIQSGSAHTENVAERSGDQDLGAQGGEDIQLAPGDPSMRRVSAIQVLSTEKDARIVIALNAGVRYNSARITGPDRIYFDLYNARLDRSVEENPQPITDGLLRWVRAAQNTEDVVRLVLDASGAKDYSARLIPDPYRLVIDVHSDEPGAAQILTSSNVEEHEANIPPSAASGRATPSSLTRELGLKVNRIAIDAGHGGYDAGAMGPHGLVEKDLCLDVALRLGHLIEQNNPDAQVIYTRKGDQYVPLEERTTIANEANADLFISIHANSSDSQDARGVETYYLSLSGTPESMQLATRENALGRSSVHDLPALVQRITRNDKIGESKEFAENIQNSLAQRLQLVSRSETNRGVKRAPFVVLTGANMPAVLSEISFLSNASDENLLLENVQRQRIAEGLYRGIEAYLDSMNSLPDRRERAAESRQNDSSEFSSAAGAAIWKNPYKLLKGGS